MINSQQDLSERVELVRWQAQAPRTVFDLTTIHSLLIDSHPKFKQLKEIIHNYNLERKPQRVRLQQGYMERLFKMLSELSRIPISENQLQYLQKIHKWATNGDAKPSQRGDGTSKSRPGTASTRTRPTTAFSRPQTGVSRPLTGRPATIKSNKPQVEVIVMKKENPCIDYDRLKHGEHEFYAGIRTQHPQYQHPKKRLKDYQRKVFYQDQPDSDTEAMETDENTGPSPLKLIEVSQEKLMQQLEAAQQEGQDPQQGAEGMEGAQGGDPNIDDIPLEGEQQGVVVEAQQQKQIIDKLKPRIKAYCPQEVHISEKNYLRGIQQIKIARNYNQRKDQQDIQLAQLEAEWAQRKGRAKSQMKRRAESARIVTKRIGVAFKREDVAHLGEENIVNFENITPIQVNTKLSRPITAFNAESQKTRQQLIKNAFITGRLSGHIQKLPQPPQGKVALSSMTSVGEKPKKKNFEDILRQAEDRVMREAEAEIDCVKQTLAKGKISIGANRIAKSISYYDHQLPGEWGGTVVGMGMLKNPFIKVAKKKKKKKKK